MPRLQNIHLPMVSKENVALMKKRMPIDGPQWTADPRAIDGFAVVGIVVMVIIHGGELCQQDWIGSKSLRAFGVP